jgi:hypothetical protein
MIMVEPRPVDIAGHAQRATNGGGVEPNGPPPNEDLAPLPPEPIVKDEPKLSIKLTKSIATHLSDHTEMLVCRQPSVSDIERIGIPVEFDFTHGFPPRPVFNTQKMTQMMAWLANVSPKSIQAMDLQDWNDMAWKLAPFFLPNFQRTN